MDCLCLFFFAQRNCVALVINEPSQSCYYLQVVLQLMRQSYLTEELQICMCTLSISYNKFQQLLFVDPQLK